MFAHTLKLMWNKKGRHLFFFIEILIVFFILALTILYSMGYLKNYLIPLGYTPKEHYIVQADFESIKDSLTFATTKKMLANEVSQIDGIESVSWISHARPLSGNNWGMGNRDYGEYLFCNFLVSDEHITKTLGLNIIKGRGFTKEDYNRKNFPIIVNQEYYDVITKIKGHEMLDSIFVNHDNYLIIGVVDHFKQNGEFSKEINYFISLDRENFIRSREDMTTNLLVKTRPGIDPSFQSQINNIYTNIAKVNNLYISDLEIARKNGSIRMWAQLTFIGIIALFLLVNISLGLIGILSYSISQRKSEIGLRKALGATTTSIVSQFVGEVILVAGIALLLGVLVVLQLPYVADFDYPKENIYKSAAISFGFIIILLLLSSIVPSLRGARIESSSALHEE